MDIPPDFNLHWCRKILTSPDTKILEIPTSTPKTRPSDTNVSNSMFTSTLYNPATNAIKAQISLTRPTSAPDSILPYESVYLLSIGTGIDGKSGRAHGGFNALVLDQITGHMASSVGKSFAPATATMTVDYKRPIDTPGVVMVRAWAVERSGRKTWVKAAIEDGEGNMLASGKALFIDPREGAKL